MKTISSSKKLSTRSLVRISVLAAMGMVLMFFDLSLWFAPPFLKLDFSDLPGMIGAFAMGPTAGILIQLIKNILSFMIEGSSTGGVGELSNFFVGSVLVGIAGLIYGKNKTFKNAIIGMIVGVLAMTVAASVSNYFIVFPLYGKVIPMDTIIDMAKKVNNLVVDYKTMILYAVVPFNLIKGSLTSLITILIYKRVSPLLKS